MVSKAVPNCCCVVYFICLIVCLSGAIYGCVYCVEAISQGWEYISNGSEESCTLIDYVPSNCTYECNCTRGDATCQTCHGLSFEYEAVVPSKCQNTSLFSDESDNEICPSTLKDMGTDHTCYVLGCNQGVFTLYSPGYNIIWGFVLLAACCICVCVPIIGGFTCWRDQICPKSKEISKETAQ